LAAGAKDTALGVIHLIVEHGRDLTNDLRSVSGLDAPFPLQAGRRDEAKHGGSGVRSLPSIGRAILNDTLLEQLLTRGALGHVVSALARRSGFDFLDVLWCEGGVAY
jgi:hypothetical protein